MCCLLAFCRVWRRVRLWLELFTSTVGWFLSQLSYLSSYVFLRRRRSWIVTKRLPFLGMNIWKILFQFSTYTPKKNTFRTEIMRYNDLEQTNTLFLRENRNHNASNSANASCIHVAWINYDRWMLSNQYIVFCYSEQFIANFIPCFLQFSIRHSAHYVWLCSFLKRCCLIWKRKQHKFETFGQIEWITGKQWVLPVKLSKCLLRFKFFKSNRIEAVRK